MTTSNKLTVNVTRMKIKESNGMKALCTVVVGGILAINDIRVVENKSQKLIIAMPSKKMPDGTFKDICNPVNGAVRKAIQDAILAEYETRTTLNPGILEMFA